MLKIHLQIATYLILLSQTPVHSSFFENPLESWLTTLTDNIRHALKHGLPSLNVPPMDPLHVGSLHLSNKMLEGFQDMVNLTGDIENIVLEGLSTYNITKVELNLLPPHFNMEGVIPQIRFSGSHSLKGQIASWISINNQGPFSASAYSVLFNIKAGLGLKDFRFVVNDLKLQLNVGRFDFKLLNGDGFLDGVANNFISSSMKTIFNSVVPSRLDGLSEMLKNYINKILEQSV